MYERVCKISSLSWYKVAMMEVPGELTCGGVLRDVVQGGGGDTTWTRDPTSSTWCTVGEGLCMFEEGALV